LVAERLAKSKSKRKTQIPQTIIFLWFDKLTTSLRLIKNRRVKIIFYALKKVKKYLEDCSIFEKNRRDKKRQTAAEPRFGVSNPVRAAAAP